MDLTDGRANEGRRKTLDEPSPGGPFFGETGQVAMQEERRAQTSEEAVEHEISRLFTYRPPRPDQIPRYNDVRLAARMLATVIYRACPNGPDRSAAIRHLRECVMTANAAIALC
jgi:hypothetical protein